VTPDVARSRKRFLIMMAVNAVCMLIAVGFAVGHFVYGVDWMLWAVFGFVAAGFVGQLWFVRGVGRMNRGG
jgi:hypothetical protein